MRIKDLSQDSKDWLEWRNVGIGSSDAPVILEGKHFQTTRLSLWKEKVASVFQYPIEERPPRIFNNSAMQRGKALEPSCRSWYEAWSGKSFKPACGVHDTYDWMKVSLDGWNAESLTLLEIKCPTIKKDGTSDHYDALQGKIPSKYLAQLAHQVIVSGAERVIYLSRGDETAFTPLEVHVPIVWEIDRGLCERLLALELKFWNCVVNRIKPEEIEWN